MKVVVAYKWARDPQDAAVRADGSVDWRGAKMAAGEDDPAAVAVARAIAAAAGGSVEGLTIGDGDASWALARGVERVLAVPEAPSLADNAATAELLAAAVRWIGDVDVVVIGDAEAYAGVPAALAGILGWPAVLGASTATFAQGRLQATRRVGDRMHTLSLGLPALVAVSAPSAEKQAPGMKEILAARRRPISVVSPADLDSGPRRPLESRGTRVPESGSARIFTGPPESTAAHLVAALREDGLL
jgi:electron transfer flavoprotein beta subunit